MKTRVRNLALLAAVSAAFVAAPGALRAEDAALSRAKEIEKEIVEIVTKISPAYVVIGGGSGVVISADGWMLTNHHVAGSKKPGDYWRIKLPGGQSGKRYRAKMVGTDPRGDISVLKIEADHPLPFCPLADSDAVRVGDPVIALGNPFGFAQDASPTVTLGVVSATHRYQGGYSDAIQVDAPINPGNSGGPSLNLQGQVIGINGRVAVRFGNRVNTGVGYAIPANQIKNFMAKFKAGGVVEHGFLGGVTFRDHEKGNDGARVARVRPGTSAAQAGLKVGDIIVGMNEYEIPNAARLNGVIGTYPAGTEATLKVQRGDATKDLTVSLDSRPQGQNAPFLGVRMNQELPEGGKGVEVEEVINGSAAEKAGMQSGDIILKLAGKETNSSESISEAIGGHKIGDEIEIVVQRGEEVLTLKATLGRRQ